MNSIAELKAAVAAVKGSSFISLITLTEPKTLHAKHQGRIVRLARRSGLINVNYERGVRRQRKIEHHPDPDGFEVEELWCGAGVHIGPSLIRHVAKDQEYLVLYPKSDAAEGFPIVEQDQYFVDGKLANSDKVKAFLVKPNKVPKQETNRLVSWRVIKLENIVQATVNGNLYVLRNI